MIQVDPTTFIDLGKALKTHADGKALKKNLTKGLRKAATPVIKKQRANVKRLPGAPDEWKKDASRRTRMKLETKVKKRAGVRILVTKKKGGGPLARYMNRGKWRHPVFGNREKWVTQYVQNGWFDKPANGAAGIMRDAVISGITETLKEIAKDAEQ